MTPNRTNATAGSPQVSHALHVAMICAWLFIAHAAHGASIDGLQFEGAQQEENAGIFVSGAGDINGDGFADVIIGAWKADIDGRTDVGRAYVLFGRGTGLDPDFPLSRLLAANGGNGGEGFVIVGDDTAGRLGRDVSNLGDVNGDGFDDLIVGALRADPGGRDAAGEAYVIFGRASGFPAEFRVRDLGVSGGGDGSQGFVIQGIDPSDNLGRSVSRAGDVNGDGRNDILVGALNGDQGGRTLAGEAYVIFGRDTGFPAEFALSGLLAANGGDGSEGAVFYGIRENDRAGIVADAGDVNGDGFDDIVIGAWKASPPGLFAAGEAYIVYGRGDGFPAEFELSSLLPTNGGNGSQGFVLRGVKAIDRTGLVSGAGDVNHDGIDDLLVGAWRADPNGLIDAGAVYLVFGRRTPRFPALIKLSTLFPAGGGDGSQGVVFPGSNAFDRLGSVSDAGDVNGDGIDDFVMGSWKGEANVFVPDAGEAFVVFGREGGFPPLLPLATLRPENGADGRSGAVIVGEDVNGRLGRSVSDAGDFDGDGIGDLIIGAWQADGVGGENSGEAYLVFGRPGLFPATMLVQLFDDGIANPVVGSCAGQAVTLHTQADFAGNELVLAVGGHVSLGEIENQTTSVSVPEGLSVTLFNGSGLTTPLLTLTASSAQLPTEADNQASSALVECLDPFGTPQIENPGDQIGRLGDDVVLTVSASDPNGDPLTFSATGLPPALVIGASSGVISGPLTAIGVFDVTVTVTDAFGAAASVAFVWTVTDENGNLPPSLTNPGPQSGLLGDTVTLSVVASDPNGDTLQFAASGLPPELAIDPGTGVISGTLSMPGVFDVEVTVDDGNGGVAAVSFGWTVAAALIDADFDADADGFAYIDDAFRGTSQPSYASGSYLPAGGFTGGGLQVLLGNVNDDDVTNMSGGWRRTFEMPDAPTAVISFRYQLTHAADYEADELSQVLLSVDGTLYGGAGTDYVAQLNGDGNGGSDDTTGWQAFRVEVPLSAGSHTLVLGGYNNKKTTESEFATVLIDDVLVELGNRPPVLADPGSQTSVIGEAAVLSLDASDPDGDALLFSATGLPPSLAIDPATGVISGMLTMLGVFDVEVTADDGNGGTATASFEWRVTDANGNVPPTVGNPGPQQGLVGDSVALQIIATDPDGDILTYVASGLPPSLGIDQSSGLISGTLNAGGVFDVEITVDDGNGGSDTVSFVWTVSEVLIDADFDTGTDGFTYIDDAFRGTDEPDYASGNYLPSGGFSGGGLQVLLGNVDEDNISDMSGGWRASFTLVQPATVTVSLRYRLTLNEDYEDDEFTQVLVSVDGVLYGRGGEDYVDELAGDGNGGGDDTTGWQSFSVDIPLAAGVHTLVIGGYNNEKTTEEEQSEILIDEVSVRP